MQQLIDIIIRDRESPKKCSIYPLSYRQDLKFIRSINIDKYCFEGYYLLHVDGEPLTPEDKDLPLLLIDASWKWAHKICVHPKIKCLPRRSISDFVTAYPRKSKFYTMPDNGLASVEALYIAKLIQGKEDPDLLKHYYWAESFLELNKEKMDQWREG